MVESTHIGPLWLVRKRSHNRAMRSSRHGETLPIAVDCGRLQSIAVDCSRDIDGFDPRRGTVLITAMWVILVLAGLALVFARSMREEALASANHCSAVQAQAVAEGAAEFVLATVAAADGRAGDVLAMPCEARPVGEGYFWILRTDLEEDRAHSFGISDEAARINLNSAPAEMLLNLPGMTSELADSIVDWRDPDGDVSPGGAESEYYLLLPEPYYCKNDLLETVEEVLLVNGASQEILYGEDANLNGVLDANENDSDRSPPEDDGNGELDHGLYGYVTVYSREPNVSESGEERINVNQPGNPELGGLLREAVGGDRYFQVMDRVRSARPFENVLEFYFRTGLEMEEFEQVADRLTTSDEDELVGRVNVNTAPREVLLCLPGLDESDVTALMSARGETDAKTGSVAWVAQALPEEKAVGIGGQITTRSHQFSADIVAVSGDGRAFKRYRMVVDAAGEVPRVVYWKDRTHLGWPLDPEIMVALRAGKSLEEEGLVSR